MSIQMLEGITRGYRKSQENYKKIQDARAQKKQDDELYDIKKKSAMLDLEAKVRTGEIEQILADQYEKQFKEEDAVHNATSKLETSQLNQASAKTRKESEFLKKQGNKIVGSLMMQRQQEYEVSYSGGKFKVEQRDRKVPTWKQTLGELQGGGTRTGMMGDMYNFKDRADAEKHASLKLGHNWKTEYPEAVQILDKKYGIEKPKHITSQKQAVQWLMQEKNMNQQEAVTFLREQMNK